MDRCTRIGINGGCGIDCEVLHDRECPIHEEMIDILLEQGYKEELVEWDLIEEDDIIAAEKENMFDLFDSAMGILDK